MKLIQEVQKPNSDIKTYVHTLSSILAHKIDMITTLKLKIDEFSFHLEQEEKLSRKFKKQQDDENKR